MDTIAEKSLGTCTITYFLQELLKDKVYQVISKFNEDVFKSLYEKFKKTSRKVRES